MLDRHPKADQIVSLAKGMVDTPYRHQGRTPSGLDCIGVPIVIMKELSLSDFEFTAYGKRPDPVTFKKMCIKSGCTMVPYVSRAHGDLLQMSFHAWPVHCAVLEVDEFGVEWIIHAMLARRKVVREQLTAHRDAKVSCAWRMPGV